MISLYYPPVQNFHILPLVAFYTCSDGFHSSMQEVIRFVFNSPEGAFLIPTTLPFPFILIPSLLAITPCVISPTTNYPTTKTTYILIPYKRTSTYSLIDKSCSFCSFSFSLHESSNTLTPIVVETFSTAYRLHISLLKVVFAKSFETVFEQYAGMQGRYHQKLL